MLYLRSLSRMSMALFLATAFALLVVTPVAPLKTVWASGAPMSGTNSASTTKASAQLKHVPDGLANLAYDATSKTLTVTIGLIGLAPNSTHPAHIHLGSCLNPNPGTIKYELTNVVADATGLGKSVTTISNVSNGIPATGWYINVHNGPMLAPADQYTPIACGDISNPNAQNSVTTMLGASPNPNQNATGSAQLSLNNGVLTVTVTASGLAPNSSHAAHIHAGNCLNTGSVLYDLSPLTADSAGNATKTATFSGVTAIPATGWDINVHYGTDLSTQTGYDPILCGNVVLAN